MSSRRLSFDYERTANLIMEALELDISPFLALQSIDGISAAQARYQIRKVREKHLLGVAPHRPVRATLGRRRGTRALLCIHCYTRWPCPDAFVVPPEPEPPAQTPRRRRANA